MATYTYTHPYATLRADQLVNECVAAGLPIIDCQRLGDPSETIWMISSVALTSPQQTTLTTTVNNHNGSAQTAPGLTENLIINGGFTIDQRGRGGGTPLGQVNYGVDRWMALMETSQLAMNTISPDRCRFTQIGSAAQHWGVAQWIEAGFTLPCRGSLLSLQFIARGSTSMNLRAAVLEWPGSTDSPGSSRNVVNNWASTTYSPGNFFISAVSVLAQTSSLAVTTADASFILAATPSSAANNLIAFVWSESAQAQNVYFELAQVNLAAGSTRRPYAPRPFATEMMLCRRYCLNLPSLPIGICATAGTLQGGGSMVFPTQMLRAPSVLSGSFQVNAGSAGTIGFDSPSPTGTGFLNTANNWTTNAICKINAILEAEL